MKKNYPNYLPYQFCLRAHSLDWDPQLSHKKMKTMFLLSMSKSRKLTSTFFPIILFFKLISIIILFSPISPFRPSAPMSHAPMSFILRSSLCVPVCFFPLPSFLVACYATLHPALSVRPSVGLSVRPSVCPSVTFYFFYGFYSLTSLLLHKWSSELKHGPCPPARDLFSNLPWTP